MFHSSCLNAIPPEKSKKTSIPKIVTTKDIITNCMNLLIIV